MPNFIIFGAPGAGKGTQAQKLAEAFNLTNFSTGAMLREEVNSQSLIGQEVKHIISQGDLVSDNIVNQIVKDKIKENGTNAGFIFDGYPRTLSQAENLDTILDNNDLPMVFNLEVSQEELVKRLLLRSKESGRNDDEEKVIQNRLIVYNQQTKPLLDFYKAKNRLIEINGEDTVENIYLQIEKQIKLIMQNKEKTA